MLISHADVFPLMELLRETASLKAFGFVLFCFVFPVVLMTLSSQTTEGEIGEDNLFIFHLNDVT